MNYPQAFRRATVRLSLPPPSGGVNFSAAPHLIADNQLADACNVWWRDGALRTRPGLQPCSVQTVTDTAAHALTVERCGGIWQRTENGIRLLRINAQGEAVPYTFTAPADATLALLAVGEEQGGSSGVSLLGFEGSATAADNRVLAFSDACGTPTERTPYVPTVLQGGRPTAVTDGAVNGSLLEGFNLLTDCYSCTFTPDGEGVRYNLPEGDAEASVPLTVVYTDVYTGVDVTHRATVTEDGDLYREAEYGVDGYQLIFDRLSGYFWFYDRSGSGDPAVLPAALTAGTVRATLCRHATGNRQAVCRATRFTWFGGGAGSLTEGTRAFCLGHPNEPNIVRWSALNNPLYFPENNFAYVGEESDPLTAFGHQGEMLVLFKAHSMYALRYAVGDAVTPDEVTAGTVTDPEAATALFPLRQLHPSRGCDCPDTVRLCHNRLVWATSDGRVWGLFSMAECDEHTVCPLSARVEPRLRGVPPAQLRAATAAELEDNYLLTVGNTAWLLETASVGFVNYGAYTSDAAAERAIAWQYWEWPTAAFSVEGVLEVDGRPFWVCRKETSLSVSAATADGSDRFGSPATATPITAFAETKHFDFGLPTREKRLVRAVLELGGAIGTAVQVTLAGANGWRCGTVPLYDDEMPPTRLTPNARLMRCGLRLFATGRMAFTEAQLEVRQMGEMH